MRIAALYDIHGNLPALDAVLADVARAGVDGIVIGGDVVAGPMSHATLRRLLALDPPARFIYGNAETAVLAASTGRAQKIPLPEEFMQALRWEAEQVREYHSLLAGWPMTISEEIPGLGTVLFCHATPRDENEIFLKTTPEAALVPLFDSLDASVVVCGHTHMQFDRTIGRVRVVNAGSVGMPFGEPGAYWLLLGPGIELRRTSYDVERTAERFRATEYPQAEFAAGTILQPPSEASILEMYAPVAIK